MVYITAALYERDRLETFESEHGAIWKISARRITSETNMNNKNVIELPKLRKNKWLKSSTIRFRIKIRYFDKVDEAVYVFLYFKNKNNFFKFEYPYRSYFVKILILIKSLVQVLKS